MNKKLLAFAVAAAFVAPLAAHADSGNVTVYGIMDASYDITDNGTGSAAGSTGGIRTNKVSSNSSRLGFKGNEDLGNGLSTVWQIETGINADGTAAANLNSRNTFVGLSSKAAGTLILGRHDTPYKLATRNLDYFVDGLADNRNLMGQGASRAVGNQAYNFDGRQSDVVAYISPTFSGFHAAVAYVAGAEAATASGTTKGDAWSMVGVYANGPLFASLAHERHNIGAVGSGTLGAPAAAAVAVDRSERATKLGLGYNASGLEVGFAYERITDDLNAGAALVEHNAWTLGGKYTMGSNAIKLAYTKTGKIANVNDTAANQLAVGAEHNMSKRTKLYVHYVKINNDSGVNYSLNGAGATGSVTANGNGADPSAWSLGMRHSF